MMNENHDRFLSDHRGNKVDFRSEIRRDNEKSMAQPQLYPDRVPVAPTLVRIYRAETTAESEFYCISNTRIFFFFLYFRSFRETRPEFRDDIAYCERNITKNR